MHTYTPPLLDFVNSTLSIEERYQSVRSILHEYECIISFTSKTSCIVIIQKFECVDVDSYLDYLNEIKK